MMKQSCGDDAMPNSRTMKQFIKLRGNKEFNDATFLNLKTPNKQGDF